MIFIVRYTHKDQRFCAYSYPIKYGSYWNAKRRFSFWRFDVYIGAIKGTAYLSKNGASNG